MKILSKILLICAMALPMLTGCGRVKSIFGGGSDIKNRIEMQARREASKGFAVGKMLPKGKKTVLVVSPGNKDNLFIKRLKTAFEKQYGDTLEIVELELGKTSDYGDLTVTAKDVDKALAKAAGAEIILFYDTFPADYRKLGTYDKENVKYFLFDTGVADISRIGKEIKSENGKIVGILMSRYNTGIKLSDPVEKDPQEAFDKRYIIIEKDNIDANFDTYFK